MFDYFKSYTPETGNIKKYPSMDYLRRRLDIEYRKVIDYYSHTDMVTYNTNILSQLVYQLQGDLYRYNDIEYFTKLENIKDYTARALGFNTTGNIAKPISNTLFRDNSKEIYVSLPTTYKYVNIDMDNIYNYNPIKVLYTGYDELDFYICNGKKSYYAKEGFNIIGIDITLLMLMYSKWLKDRVLNNESGNTNQFIYTIILPRINNTMLDFAIFNRLMKLYYKEPMIPNKYTHPMFVLDLSLAIDKILLEYIKDVSNSVRTLDDYIKQIPTIHLKDMANLLYFNINMYNRQESWLMWMSRISIIRFILDLMGEKGRNRNTNYIEKLQHYIRELENNMTSVTRIKDPGIKSWFDNHLQAIKSYVMP